MPPLLKSLIAACFFLLASVAPLFAQSSDDYWNWVQDIEKRHLAIKQELLPKFKAMKKGKAALSVNELYLLAICHYYSGEYQKALAIAEGLQQQQPEALPRRSRYLAALCLTQMHQGKDWSIEALDQLRRSLNSNDADPRVWLAIQSLIIASPMRNRNEQLLNFCKRLIRESEQRNDHFGGHLLSGLLLHLNWQYGTAEQELLIAYEKAPQNPATLLALLWHYRGRGMIERAVICLRELAKLNWDPRFNEELAKDEGALIRFKLLKQAGAIPAPPSPAADAEAVYRLPYQAGEAYYLANPQRYSSHPLSESHVERGEHAYDFLMPVMTPVCAVRDGVLVKKDLTGTSKGSKEFVNFVVIAHGDGTYARYYHLRSGSVRLPKGARVRAGQVFGQSERTRTSQSAHLHVEVVRRAFWNPGQPAMYQFWKTIPLEFQELKGLSAAERDNAWCISGNVMVVKNEW